MISMMTAAAPVPPPLPTPALTEAHLRALADAAARARPVRRAAAVARFDGWAVATFAALTFLFSLGSAPGMLLGAAMGVIAFVELRGAARLARFDPGAARTLGRNQLALAAALIAYALFQIHAELTGAGAFAEVTASDPQLAGMLQPFEGLTRQVTLLTYGSLIAVALCAQGGLALYYFRRQRHVADYLAHTPPWVVAVQRAGASAA
jgi:hypothetical protein